MPLGKNLKKDTLIPSEKKEEKKESVAKKKTEAKAKSKPKAKKETTTKKVAAKAKAAPKPKAKKKVASKKTAPKKVSEETKVAPKEVAQEQQTKEEPQMTPGQLAALAVAEADRIKAEEEANKTEEVVEEEVHDEPEIVPAVSPYEKEYYPAAKYEQDRELIRKKIGTVKYLTEEEYQEKQRLKAKFDQEIKGYAGKEIQLIVFQMGDEKYAIEIDRIKEVVPTPRISKIPHAPSFIKGVSNVRGTVMVILDLGQKFGLDTSENLKEFVLVIQSKEFKAGILVDEVPLTVKVNGDNIVSSSGLLRNTSLDETYIKGIIKGEEDMIIFIDIVELVQEDEVSIISQSLLG
ncbi:chemotaxis protein CheW [Reichenbachiella ulvae]|uniref:Chemotaxis protein CheW n=1 Tax=Reichenbachiella ulvae TaxID=2980104 RepID=A0ABT3CPR4_9BACT|nr:chemotaxis protein CheW [Reichenbachiella ulvae]MCV9385634.1 chemotaxis protein CheW [Reichenbachiella ulvae]